VILRVEDMPAEGLEVTVPLSSGMLDSEGVKPVAPVTGTFRLTRRGSRILVKGRVTGSFSVTCSRCLGEAAATVDEDVSVEFRPLEAEDGGSDDEPGRERELTGGELDVEFYRGGVLDMAEFLAEQVRLALPMKPLCSPSCPGLCPVCGRSRQEGCGCEVKAADGRWEALRSLLKR
jgi:uncharacterized protein